jgi:DNA-binding NarL/FixJ family response regulator
MRTSSTGRARQSASLPSLAELSSLTNAASGGHTSDVHTFSMMDLAVSSHTPASVHHVADDSAVTRVVVISGAAIPSVGVAALLAASNNEGAAFLTATRGVDAIREIGNAPSLEVARRAAESLVLGSDVVIVALHDELVRLDERAVSLGIETLAHVGVPVLLLNDFGNESDEDFDASTVWLRRGVRGLLTFDASAPELASALHSLRAGHVVVEPRVSQMLLTLTRPAAKKRPRVEDTSRTAANGGIPLSAREREVLALLAQGLATKNIAHQLGISAHTVKAHVESIFAKFGATTRAEAVAIGVRRGAVLL